MQISSSNNFLVELLTSSRLKVVRHLILFIFIFSISIGFVSFIEEQAPLTALEKYAGLFFFASVFLSVSYFNICILTPRLLLENKWGLYFLSLAGVVLLMLIVIILGQTVGIDRKIASGDSSSSFLAFKGIINILSSSLAFFLLFSGTSTLVLFKNWILDMKQSEELESATLQMELKLLENQINPHFLFNMLNSANIMIKKDPDIAVHIIGKMEEMLRYLMNESIQERVSLKNEIVFLEDFLELENTRRDYFNYTISKEGEIDNVQIAPLLFIAFVENAVKHNQDSKATSYVHVLFRRTKDKLIFICENSVPQSRSDDKGVGGIGLTNIKRRLNLLYKENYSLEQTKTDANYVVKLELNL